MQSPDTTIIHAEGVFVLPVGKVDDSNEAYTLYLLSLPPEDTQIPLSDGRIVPKRERAVVVDDGETIFWGDQEPISMKPEDYGVITGAVDINDAGHVQAALREAMEECELSLDSARLVPVGDARHIEVNQHRNGTEYEFTVRGFLYLMTQKEWEVLVENMKKLGRDVVELHWNGKKGDAVTLRENVPPVNFRPVTHAVLQLLTELQNPIVYNDKGT